MVGVLIRMKLAILADAAGDDAPLLAKVLPLLRRRLPDLTRGRRGDGQEPAARRRIVGPTRPNQPRGRPEAEALRDLFAVIRNHRSEYVSDGVGQVLGRQPRDFTDWARATAAKGAWTAWTSPAHSS